MLAGSIADSKLSTISTASKVSNSATTATNANTSSAIVARDGSGDFSCNQITMTLDPVIATYPTFSCKTFVNFVGTASPCTINCSGNVTSVTRPATGIYKINFTTALPSAVYCVQVTATRNGSGISDASCGVLIDNGTYTPRATTYAHVFTAYGRSAYYNDGDVNVTIYF
jgi:hypothetical protein